MSNRKRTFSAADQALVDALPQDVAKPTPSQLERLRQVGAAPPAERRGLGYARGSKSVVPAGAVERLADALRAKNSGYRLETIPLVLFVRERSIDEAALKGAFLALLRRVREAIESIPRDEDSTARPGTRDYWFDVADAAARALKRYSYRHPTIKQWRRRAKGRREGALDLYPVLMYLVVSLFTDVTLPDSVVSDLVQASGLAGAARDTFSDMGPMYSHEGDLVRAASDALSILKLDVLREVIERADLATLSQARDEFRRLIHGFSGFAELLGEEVGLENAFGFAVAQGLPLEDELAFAGGIVAWLAVKQWVAAEGGYDLAGGLDEVLRLIEGTLEQGGWMQLMLPERTEFR